MKYPLIIFFLLTCCFACNTESLPLCDTTSQSIIYPFVAHAHNDYEQDIPVSTALDHGFASLEVDIAFDGIYIRVSHDDEDLFNKPKFEESYLASILSRPDLGSNGLILLIDIKAYSDALLSALFTILIKHEDRLVSRDEPNEVENKIKLILSGDIPRTEIITHSTNPYLFVDGRLNETDLNASSIVVPMISIDFMDIPELTGAYNNEGSTEEMILKSIDIVQSKEKMIRFWNTKNKESLWLSLIELGVDQIGVDDIEYFCQIMKKNGIID